MMNRDNIFDNLDEIFTQDWYDNVVKAANFAMQNTKNKNISDEALALYIIDYNINKRLHEKVLENLVSTLPKIINWENKDLIDAFNEFKDIIDSCDICPNFKKYKAKIITGQSGLMTNEFLLWKELVNTHYPKLNLVTTPLKTKNHYTLEITKID